MNLPDYLQCVEIRQLHAAMGILEIPLLPVLQPFERKIVENIVHEELDLKEVEFDRRLETSSIRVKKSELQGKPDELLTLNGRKVCAYIRDQGSSFNSDLGMTTYRYHLCNCKTMQSMRDMGREGRYLATKRDDGFFEVYDKAKITPQKPTILEMELCQNCIKVLKSRGLYFYPFSLKQYFEKNDTSIPKTIRRIETVTKIQTYTPNQEDISRAYREKVNFICQECNVSCLNKPYLLHLHHINGDPSNNSRHNLQVLCIDCHSSKPLHSQVSKNINYKEQIKLIKRMRIEQNLLTVSGQ